MHRIIDAGADVNTKNKDGLSALMGAAIKGHTETVKTLLGAGAARKTFPS